MRQMCTKKRNFKLELLKMLEKKLAPPGCVDYEFFRAAAASPDV